VAIGIRRARVADAEAITRIHESSRRSYYRDAVSPDADGGEGRRAFWTRLFLDENITTFCGSLDGDLKGFLSFRSANSVDSANGPAAELTALYVEPSAWSNGIGSSLYEQFLHAIPLGQIAALEVWQSNERAVNFYLKRGWTVAGGTRPGPEGTPFVELTLVIPG
jgi:ribosomal protein S18 acetylase RimI-like enzyme